MPVLVEEDIPPIDEGHVVGGPLRTVGSDRVGMSEGVEGFLECPELFPQPAVALGVVGKLRGLAIEGQEVVFMEDAGDDRAVVVERNRDPPDL